jgi:hypothetical protein
MQLPPNFRIMITGKTIDVIRRNNVDNKSAMVWYLTKLLEGEELPDDVFRPWKVEVEVDMDQGEE